VLGQEPPVEYRLGRSGASSSAEEGVAAQAPRQDEAADTPPEPAVDLEASVLAELGGEIIEDVTDGQEDG
jgi:hypothetical protein